MKANQAYLSPLRPPITHVCVTVTDIHAAIDWYTHVLGIRLAWGPFTWKPESEADAETGRHLFDPQFESVRLAHGVFDNGLGIEFFEFVRPASEIASYEYWRTGVNHFGIRVPDVAAFAQFVVEAGGKQRSTPLEFMPGCILTYIEDPWGNVIELYNRDHAEFYVNRQAVTTSAANESA